MSRASRPLLIALALTTTLGLSACGDKSLSKADYIAKVDPIYQKYKDQSDKLTEPQTSDPAAFGTYYSQLADLADQQTKEIDDVGRPKEDKAHAEDLLNRERTLVGKLREAADAVKANDENKVNQIGNEVQPEGDKLDADLKAFGFKNCGSA